jgi:PKD repeat protein
MKKIYKVALMGLLLFASSCGSDKDIEILAPEEPKPLVNFSYSQAEANDAFTLEFKSTIENGKNIRWEFGDDSTSVEANPEHTFLAPGIYRVFLTVENSQGYKAQREEFIKLTADKVLSVAATPQSGGDIQLKVSSETEYTDFQWRFEDNTTSTEATPITNVAAGTIKKVTLTAKTSKGSSVTINRLITNFGVGEDITQEAALTVSKENDYGKTSSEGSPKLIDNNLESKWLLFDFSTTVWAQQSFKTPEIVKFYSLTSGGDAEGRDPKDWILEGSSDGNTWDLLDTRVNQIFDKRTETKLFIVDNDKAYLYYRWTVKSNNGDGLFQISEWRLNKIS